MLRFLIGNCRERLFEWVMTMAMLGLAIEIAVWPGTIGASAFRYMLQFMAPADIGAMFAVAGLARIGALIANGRLPLHGPLMRAIGAGLAAVIWAQMDLALVMLAPHNNGIPSPGIPIYFSLTIGELISAYRAMADVRRYRHR